MLQAVNVELEPLTDAKPVAWEFVGGGIQTLSAVALTAHSEGKIHRIEMRTDKGYLIARLANSPVVGIQLLKGYTITITRCGLDFVIDGGPPVSRRGRLLP